MLEGIQGVVDIKLRPHPAKLLPHEKVFKYKYSSGPSTYLIMPTLGRKRQADFRVQGHPDFQSNATIGRQ